MATDPLLLKRRVDRLDAQQATFRTDWQTLGEYLLPRKSNITRTLSPGRKQTTRLFDSTGLHAAEILAASLGGTLTSPAQPWFSLVMRQKEINDQKDVADWLEEVAARVYLALNQSNFTSEIQEVYLDLAVFGTGALYVEERPSVVPNRFGGFRFCALATAAYWIAEDAEQRVDTLFRKHQMTAAAIQERYPQAATSETLRRLATDKPEELVTVWHGVYPRESRNERRANRTNKAWASCVFVVDRGEPFVLDEGGFDEFPFMVPRWAKTPGEVYGRGPGHMALPDVRSLNRAVELYFSAAAKAIDPPLLVKHDGVLGTLSLEPGALNVVETENALQPLEVKTRFEMAQDLFERLERKIRQIYYVDQLELKDSPAMTATEVVIRNELMQRLLGPTAGRLHSELLSPLITRCVGLMLRANALPPLPDTLLNEGLDAEMDVQFEGPLARAQRMNDLVAIERKNAWVAQVLPFYPEAEDLFDYDEEGREVAKVTGVPSSILRGKEQVDQMRAARQQAQAAQAKLAAMQQMAESAGKAAPMVRELQNAGTQMAGAA